MPNELLLIDTQRGQVLYNGVVVRSITKHWAYVYGLLALHRLEQQARQTTEPGVTAEQINRLPTWAQVQAKSVSTSMFRHLSSPDGTRFIATPPHERTKRFWLRPELSVTADVDLEKLRQWLGLTTQQPADEMTSGSIMAAHWFGLAQIALDQGRFFEVETYIKEGRKAQPTKNQEMQGLAIWAQALISGAKPPEARAVLDLMHQLVQQARLPQPTVTVNQDQLSPVCEALVWIHEARLAWRIWQPRKLKQYVNKAAALLDADDHREWAGLEAALGYLAQRTGNLAEAEKRYKAALLRSAAAYMNKGIQFQQINLAALYFIQYQNNQDQNPSLAHSYLEQGLQLTLAAKSLSDALDLSGNGDIEVNLAFAYREKGQYAEAQHLIDRAFNIGRACNSTYIEALAHAEQAELSFNQGQLKAAQEQWLRALDLLKEIGVDGDWPDQIQQRLRELSGEVPLTHALKLW